MKKTITLFTLAAFIIFSLNCYSMKQMEVKTAVEKKGTKIAILGVTKTSGEYIKFSRNQPGKIRGNTIEGRIFDKQEIVTIPWSEVEYLHIEELSLLPSMFLIAGIIAGSLVLGLVLIYVGLAIFNPSFFN